MGNGEINFSFGSKDKLKQNTIPLRIIVVGDFNGANEDTRTEDQHPSIPALQSVDKYSLESFFNTLAVNVYLDAPHFFSPTSRKQHFQFSPKSLNDFTPKGMLENITELKRLTTLKTQISNFPPGVPSSQQIAGLVQSYGDIAPLTTVFEQLSNAEQRSVTAAKTSAPTSPPDAKTPASQDSEDAVSRLLDMVDDTSTPVSGQGQNADDNAANTAQLDSREDAFISHVVDAVSGSKTISNSKDAGRKSALQTIDNILQQQVNYLLHNKKLQHLESLWRGLKFLVDRTNFREAIEIHCLTTSRENLLSNLKSQVIDNVINPGDPEPDTVILSTFYISNTSSELNDLQSALENAESSQIPLLFALNDTFLDIQYKNVAQLNANPVTWFDQTQYQQWNTLRDKTCARWGVALYNRYILRHEYDSTMRQSAGIAEQINSMNDSLWGHPGFALLALIAGSYARTGWPTEIQGNVQGELDDLCLRHVEPQSGQAFSTALETLLTLEQVQDLSATGITTLAGSANDDRAYIYYTPCLWQNTKYSDERYTELSKTMNNLAYQLLLARLARSIAKRAAVFRQITDNTEVAHAITGLLRELLSTSGPGTAVTLNVENDEENQRRVVYIQARTGKNVLNGADIEFGLTI